MEAGGVAAAGWGGCGLRGGGGGGHCGLFGGLGGGGGGCRVSFAPPLFFVFLVKAEGRGWVGWLGGVHLVGVVFGMVFFCLLGVSFGGGSECVRSFSFLRGSVCVCVRERECACASCCQ